MKSIVEVNDGNSRSKTAFNMATQCRYCADNYGSWDLVGLVWTQFAQPPPFFARSVPVHDPSLSLGSGTAVFWIPPSHRLAVDSGAADAGGNCAHPDRAGAWLSRCPAVADRPHLPTADARKWANSVYLSNIPHCGQRD